MQVYRYLLKNINIHYLDDYNSLHFLRYMLFGCLLMKILIDYLRLNIIGIGFCSQQMILFERNDQLLDKLLEITRTYLQLDQFVHLLKQVVFNSKFNEIPNDKIKWTPSTNSSKITERLEGGLLLQNLKHLVSLANSPTSTNKAKIFLPKRSTFSS